MLTNREFAALIVPIAQASYFRLLLRQAELMAATWLPYRRDQWRAHRSYSLTSLRFPRVARDVDLSYEALVPLALHSGERSKLPTVKASLQHIKTPGSRDHINLLFLEQDREIILNILNTAQPSYLAGSNVMNSWLFANLTLPLARGEVDVVQAAQQAQNWLKSYLNE